MNFPDALFPQAWAFGAFLPYYSLLGFAEAWLNGALITRMVVYAPHWVGSFDDWRYLLNNGAGRYAPEPYR